MVAIFGVLRPRTTTLSSWWVGKSLSLSSWLPGHLLPFMPDPTGDFFHRLSQPLDSCLSVAFSYPYPCLHTQHYFWEVHLHWEQPGLPVLTPQFCLDHGDSLSRFGLHPLLEVRCPLSNSAKIPNVVPCPEGTIDLHSGVCCPPPPRPCFDADLFDMVHCGVPVAYGEPALSYFTLLSQRRGRVAAL